MTKQISKDSKYYQKRANIAKAIAHPSRLLIIDALAKNDLCVCEINELIKADQSTVSKHLAILKNIGLLEDIKKGQHVYYHLRCKCILDFMCCAEGVLNSQKE